MKHEDFVKMGIVPKIDTGTNNSGVEYRIVTSLLAFAAGDAVGVEYEITKERKPVQIFRLGTREDWPFGGVSDDTLLTLITIKSLSEGSFDQAPARFLNNLRDAVPKLRGLGPTTRAALGIPLPPDLKSMVGNTNGGLMRTSVLGLMFSYSERQTRRALVFEMAKATHKDLIACYAAVLTSALFSEALEKNPRAMFKVLEDEVAEIPEIPNQFRLFLENYNQWNPPESGISLESIETLRAITWCIDNAKSCLDAFKLACELGGDTDTVAAQAGALFCAQNPNQSDFYSIPWLPEILWQEIESIKTACEYLIAQRLKGQNERKI